jgi:hypothetical protein
MGSNPIKKLSRAILNTIFSGFFPNKNYFYLVRSMSSFYSICLHVINFVSESRISPSQKHPTALIEAIRGYIASFFGCRDCSENFANETGGYEDEIKEPVDDIMYLWDGKSSLVSIQGFL